MAAKCVMLVVSVICFTLLRHVECSGENTGIDPCDVGNHSVLDAADRLHTIEGNNGNCDDQLDEGWYKFVVNDRPAEIPHVCLKNNVCGTQLPMRIDLAGKGMPDVNETVDAFVCTSYDVLRKWDCCVLRQPIKIKKCDNFYVYRLKPTDRCPVAYCAQENGVSISQNLTLKPGDDVTDKITTPVVSNTETTTNPTTDVSLITGSNMTGSVTTDSEVTQTTHTEDIVTFTTVTPQHNVTFSENVSSVSTTSAADVSPNNTDQTTTWNVTIATTELNSSRQITTLSSSNATFFDNVSDAINISTTLPSTTIESTGTSTDAAWSSNLTTSSVQTSDANMTENMSVDLTCTSWEQTPCPNGNTTCYLSPSDNTTYMVCADGTKCGEVCNVFPDCFDDSDEQNCAAMTCIESQWLCSDGTNCYTRCDGHVTCVNPAAGEDEEDCPSASETSTFVPANSTLTTTISSTRNFTEESITDSSPTLTTNTITTTDNRNDQAENVTDINDLSSTTTTSFLTTSTDITSTDISDESSATTGNESVTGNQTTTPELTSVSDPENETSTIIIPPTTDSAAISSESNLVDTTTIQGVTESNIVTTTASSSIQDLTTVNEHSTSGYVTADSTTTRQTVSSSQAIVTSHSSDSVHITTESSESSSTSVELVTDSTSASNIYTISTESSSSHSHTSTEMDQFITTTDASDTIISTEYNVSIDTTSKESIQQSSTRVTDSTTISTSGDIDETTLGRTSITPRSSDGELISAGHPDSTSTPVRMTTFAGDDLSTTPTATESTNISVKPSSVTGSEASTSVGDNVTDHTMPPVESSTPSGDNITDSTIHVEREKTGLYYENFGLFVFLIVAAVVIVGICIFGIIGYAYQRRLRTWNPTMAYQDAYGDLEKKTLPFGREKFGVESPIPDFDILRDEKKFEETSLSQASTLVLGQSTGRSGPPFDDSYGEDPRDGMTNGKPNDGSCQQNFEPGHIANGHSNEGPPAYENGDGVVPVDEIDMPVDEIDTSPPRTLFPWIENAADTKL